MKMFQTKVVEKIETYLRFNFFFIYIENRGFCEIMWKRVVQPDRPYKTM